ncbi:hypothetical protein [Cellulomonas sp. IC4_254]|uniref:hypothetical protein n=1 Tax=Cellulomonas sp. IC4_254 TaxID=2714040 RepID=UPI0014219207|nr:hypothetical protein [Cellulomonas sp. IC4_254]NHT16219.1 hypothetical protein [Cellulomonas sp. IC4_254]
MQDSKRTTWVAGTVLLAVAILALAWFVFVAPVVEETSTVASDTQVAQDRNAALTNQLDTLKDQFANLQASKDELAVIAAQLPATANTSAFLRTVENLKNAAGTNVVDVQFGVPEDVIPAAAVADGTAAAAPATEGTTEGGDTAAEGSADASTDTSTDTAAADPAAAAAPVIPGFVAIPVSVTALGNPVGVLTFLDALQQQSDRLMLVTNLQGTGQAEEEQSGGRPATAEGDLELVISGYIYVLKDTTTPATGDGTAPETPALPEGAPSLSGA